jgi:hypothetical protein
VDDPDSLADAIWRMVQRLPSLEEEKVRAVARPFDSAAVAQQAISYYEEVLKS